MDCWRSGTAICCSESVVVWTESGLPWVPGEEKGLYPSKVCPWLPRLGRNLNPVRLPIRQLRAGATTHRTLTLVANGRSVGDGLRRHSGCGRHDARVIALRNSGARLRVFVSSRFLGDRWVRVRVGPSSRIRTYNLSVNRRTLDRAERQNPERIVIYVAPSPKTLICRRASGLAYCIDQPTRSDTPSVQSVILQLSISGIIAS